MNLVSELIDCLNSSGNSYFKVLFNYSPLKSNGKNVFVKRVFIKGSVIPEFGYFVSIKGKNQFMVINDSLETLENAIKNKTLGDYDFSREFPNDDFIIEINEQFKIINIVQKHFSVLCEQIYKAETLGKLSTQYQVLDVSDCEKIFGYFEDIATESYLDVLDSKILKSLRADRNVKFYNSLVNFTLVYFKGPCLLNPFVDCGRYRKVFESTSLFKYIKATRFQVGANEVAFLTNKEICECLHLKKFVKFNSIFFMNIVLGLLNPVKNYSTYRHVYVVKGEVVNEADYLRLGLTGGERVPSLLILVIGNKKRLNIKNNLEWYEILKEASL